MRVLHVIDSLEPGGAERQLELLVRSLSRADVESVVCALHRHGEIEGSLREAGIEVFALGGCGKHAELPALVARLVRVVVRTRPDLIHTSLAHADMAGAAAGLITGVPVVATICSQFGSEQRANRVPPWRIRAVGVPWGWALRRASRCIAVSEAVRESAIVAHRLQRRRLRVVYRADKPLVGPVPDPSQTRTSLGLRHDAFVFVNVGRLVPSKGQDDVVRAFARIAEAWPEAHLLIVGEGTFRGALERLIAGHGLESRVRLLGARSDVPAVLAAADAFVFPSRSEGFSGALLEAMSAGLPCIVGDVPPMTEAVADERSGLCVPLEDIDALARAMGRLVADRELSTRLGQAARAEVRTRFSASAVAAQTLAVYREVLGDPRAQRLRWPVRRRADPSV
jgi:glycosyltransferase involved in cell wall biosynthesis